MNFKTTILLIVLAVGVGAYLYFFELNTPTTYEIEQLEAQQADRDGEALFTADALSTEAVAAVRIERGGEVLAAERRGEDWWQVEPVRFPLSRWTLRDLIDDAASLRHVGTFEAGEGDRPPLAELGLDPPRAVVTLEAGESLHTIRVGRRSLAGRGYVAVDGREGVYVVNDALHRAVLDEPLTKWRATSLNGPEAGRVEAATLKREGETIRLHRHDGRWFLDAGLSQRAAREAVEELVGSLSWASVRKFVEDSPADLATYGLAEPRYVLSVEAAEARPADGDPDAGSNGSDKTEEDADAADESSDADAAAGKDADASASTDPPVTRYTLRIGAAELGGDEHYATWSVGSEPSNVVFTVGKSLLERLTGPLGDLRDPRIVTSEVSDVKELTIERPDAPPLHVQRSESQGYAFGEPSPGFAADYDAVRSLIETVTTAEATGYTTELPDDEPAARVTLVKRGSGLTESVSIWRDAEPTRTSDADGSSDDAAEDEVSGTEADSPRYVVVRQGETVGYLVSADELSVVFEPAAMLRDRSILDLAELDATRLTLVRDDGARFTFEQRTEPVDESDGEPTETSETAEASAERWVLADAEAVEREAIDALIEALSPLRVASWSADPVEPGDGAIVLEVEPAEGASPRALRVNPQTRQGRISGIEQGFVLPAEALEALTAEFCDRLVLPFGIDEMSTVTVEEGVRTLAIYRDATDRYVSETGDPIRQSAAGSLFDTLAGLEVERYEADAPSPDAEPEPEIDRTLRITTSAGAEHTIRLSADTDARLVWIDGRAATLSAEDFEALTASLRDQTDAADRG